MGRVNAKPISQHPLQIGQPSSNLHDVGVVVG
jgi:hypothetical protein